MNLWREWGKPFLDASCSFSETWSDIPPLFHPKLNDVMKTVINGICYGVLKIKIPEYSFTC